MVIAKEHELTLRGLLRMTATTLAHVASFEGLELLLWGAVSRCDECSWLSQNKPEQIEQTLQQWLSGGACFLSGNNSC